MEPLLREIAGHVALAAKLVCVLCIAIGATVATQVMIESTKPKTRS